MAIFNIQTVKRGKRRSSLLNGLVSYWKMDESSGTRADSHGSNNLVDNNTVGNTTGKVSLAANLVTANLEYLSIANNSSVQTGDIDYTFAYWLKLTDKSNTFALICKYDTGLTNQLEFYSDYNNSGDNFRFIVTPDGTSASQVVVTATNFGAPTAGIWYFMIYEHIAATNTIAISVNNGTPNTNTVSSSFASTSALEIGRSGALGRHANAAIDEVGFWKRSLTSAEKSFLYNSGVGRAYPFSIV